MKESWKVFIDFHQAVRAWQAARMSFSNLRRARAARQPASYVHKDSPPQTDAAHANESAPYSVQDASGSQGARSPTDSAVSRTETRTEVRSEIAQPVTLREGCYKALPPVVSVKKTKTRGRGLYANVDIPAGEYDLRTHVGRRSFDL